MNYIKDFVNDIKVAQIFLDVLIGWYNDNITETMPRLMHKLIVIKYPNTEDFGPSSRIARHDGVWISTNLNVTFNDNGGHRRYGNVHIEYDEADDHHPDIYMVDIGNFNLTLDVHTPFSMTADLYKTMFDTAKRELNEFYSVEFNVPTSDVNDVVIKHKLATS